MIAFRGAQLEKSRLFLEKAVEIYREGGKDCDPNLINSLFVIGTIHKMQEKAKDSESVWSDAYEMSKKAGDGTNPKVRKMLGDVVVASH